MKKKEIEKIPYLTLPKSNKSKKVRYIGITALKNIGNERHIILEVYRNKKDCLQIPVVRYVANKNDWGVFFPESNTWTKQKITTNDWHEGMCWASPGESGSTYGERSERNILYSEDDLKRIQGYFKAKERYMRFDWWDHFESNETTIKNIRVSKVYENRRKRLEEREKNTPELQEKELLEWADTNIFHKKHFLYYKKKGRYATIACSKCGGVSSGAWKTGESYESQFEKGITEPRDKYIGHCPLCGASGTYYPQGRAHSKYGYEDHVFMASRYKEDGVVIRYVQLNKEFQLELMAGEKEDEMHGAYEILSGVEIARKYFVPGKKTQVDYHKHNPYTGNDFWDDCNLDGLKNITIKEAGLYPEFAETLKGTELQYSQITEFIKHADDYKVNAFTYLERYRETPQIEMLVKLKLYEIVKKLARCEYGILQNEKANRLENFLGINKDKIKLLIEAEGNVDMLRVLQMEKRYKQHWTENQVKNLTELKADYRVVNVATKYMTIQKVLNWISKYAGCEYGTGCTSATARLIHTATTYFDYLSMRNQLGYDLNNTVYQRPRDLTAAHNKMANEVNKVENDKRILETEEKYPLIRRNYRKLRNRYFYEDETYIIRPARSATEIVTEGRFLHHCVGGDNYLSSHNNGKTTILMLRYKTSQDIPYITVEIKGNEICQWYGAHDKKPDKDNRQKWLNAYTTRLKCTTQEKEIAIKVPVAAVG